MEIRNRIFPYPVLSEETEDYSDSDFNVEVDVSQEINSISIMFSINLDNRGLQQLINHGDASFAIHVECSKTAYRKLLVSQQKKMLLHIPITRINGDIAFVGMIIAKKDIAYYRNEKLNDDYAGMDIIIPRAGIMAYQNMSKIRVTKNYEELKTSSSIFSIVKRAKDNEDMHPMEFELTKEKIRIVVDENIYSSYIRYSTDQDAKELLWSLVLLPAILFMLERLRTDGITAYEEMEWYQIISSTYNGQGINFEETVLDKDIPITDIAQEMLRLPIGKSFESLKRMSGGEFE